MSELYNSIEKISNNGSAPMVGGAIPMVGGAIPMVGGIKLSFIQKYYNFIKKYKFILFFFITIMLSFLIYKNGAFIPFFKKIKH